LGDRKDFNVVLSQQGRGKNPALLIFYTDVQPLNPSNPNSAVAANAHSLCDNPSGSRISDKILRHPEKAIGRGMFGRGMGKRLLTTKGTKDTKEEKP
jgi:hypothetical protein